MSAPRLACIGLGSNLGPSLRLLQAAWRLLGRHPAIETLRLSSPYRTQPQGLDTDHWFINAAGLLRTSLTPEALLAHLHELENQHGRVRSPHATEYQDRTLDLDLLLYGDLILRQSTLTLPHPRMLERRFVLAPLAEIAPDLMHPLARKPIATLLCALDPAVSPQAVVRICWPRERCTEP